VEDELMRCALVAAVLLLVTTTCPGADERAKATRVIEGVKTTFPARSIPKGVTALVGVLESCSSVSDSTIPYTPDELKKARKGDHVRFVFSRPLKVEVGGKKVAVSEAVYAKGVFWLASGNNVVRCTKYTIKMDRFRAWYRQTLPAD
jgi:hypothetical protein